MEEKLSKTRKPFTPGWEENLVVEEGLPIKFGNKVIPVRRITGKRKISEDDEEANEKIIDDDDNDEDISKPKGAKGEDTKLKSKSAKTNVDLSIEIKNKSMADYTPIKQLIADICISITTNPEICVSKKPQSVKSDNPDFNYHHISELLLLTVDKDPVIIELAVLSTSLVFIDICPGYRIRPIESQTDENGNLIKFKKETKRLVDYEKTLLQYYQQYLNILQRRADWGLYHLTHNNNNNESSPNDAATTTTTNNNNSHHSQIRAFQESLAITCIRCQCELLKSLIHFNFHSLLMNNLLQRILMLTQSINSTNTTTIIIIDIIANCFTYILSHDFIGEISFEFTTLLNKYFKLASSSKTHHKNHHNINQFPISILQCLEHIKVTVKASDAIIIRNTVKKQLKHKKRSKKNQNNNNNNSIEQTIENNLLETELMNNTHEFQKKRFQVNILQEMTLLYFRILKQSQQELLHTTSSTTTTTTNNNNHMIVSNLLPTALAGLGRITHLIDVDMIVDMMTILRMILDNTTSNNTTTTTTTTNNNNSNHTNIVEIRILCLYCALFTLAGPGYLLHMDDEPYLIHLQATIQAIPSTFTQWVALYDMMELYFIQRREEKMSVIENIIIASLIIAYNQCANHNNNNNNNKNNNQVAIVFFTLAHMLCLRYPRVRQSWSLWNYTPAIMNLRTETLRTHSDNNNNNNNSSSLVEIVHQIMTTKNTNNNNNNMMMMEDEYAEDLAMKGLIDGSALLSKKQKKKIAKRQDGLLLLLSSRSEDITTAVIQGIDRSLINSIRFYYEFETSFVTSQQQVIFMLLKLREQQLEQQQQQETTTSSSSLLISHFKRIFHAFLSQDILPIPINRDSLLNKNILAMDVQENEEGQEQVEKRGKVLAGTIKTSEKNYRKKKFGKNNHHTTINNHMNNNKQKRNSSTQVQSKGGLRNGKAKMKFTKKK
jgi:hypothetical protein